MKINDFLKQNQLSGSQGKLIDRAQPGPPEPGKAFRKYKENTALCIKTLENIRNAQLLVQNLRNPKENTAVLPVPD